VTVRVLIEPLGDHALNLGDVAMRQVAVRRLRALWPAAEIVMLTKDAEELTRAIPGVEALEVKSQRAWFHDLTPEALRARLPSSLANHVAAGERLLRTRWPRGVQRAVSTKRRVLRQPADDGQAFLQTVLASDLILVSGAGAINDHFGGRISRAFDLMALAIERGIPTAMVGQGLGPLTDGATLAAARRVLPRVDLIGLREDRTGGPLLEQLGVPAAKVVTTGDDAVELAHELREDVRGDALGLNVRVAGYVRLGQSELATIADQIRSFVESRRPALIPVPTSRHSGEADLEVARSIAAQAGASLSRVDALETPEQAVRQVALCRVLITGSYHAAVFALAQGIPAVCLAPNAYYLQKFDGLEALFGDGCFVVRRDFTSLAATVTDAWQRADDLREPLLAAAAAQIARGKDAYARIGSFVQAVDD
jgi:colanic acid/amylovoran biosynthesis protein